MNGPRVCVDEIGDIFGRVGAGWVEIPQEDDILGQRAIWERLEPNPRKTPTGKVTPIEFEECSSCDGDGFNTETDVDIEEREDGTYHKIFVPAERICAACGGHGLVLRYARFSITTEEFALGPDGEA